MSAAEEYLSFAFEHCHRASQKNKRMILIYLLPVKMLLVSHFTPLSRPSVLPTEAHRRLETWQAVRSPRVRAPPEAGAELLGVWPQPFSPAIDFLLRRLTYVRQAGACSFAPKTLNS